MQMSMEENNLVEALKELRTALQDLRENMEDVNEKFSKLIIDLK